MLIEIIALLKFDGNHLQFDRCLKWNVLNSITLLGLFLNAPDAFLTYNCSFI
jgi:hypothetical protein